MQVNETNKPRLEELATVRDLTRITVYNAQKLDSDFKHVFDFPNRAAVDAYLEAQDPDFIDDVGYSYQRRDFTIRFSGHYEDIKNKNYIRIENRYLDPKHRPLHTVWYGFIKDMKYINDRMTVITWGFDPWNTYLPLHNAQVLGDVFVEKGHQNDLTSAGGNIQLVNLLNEESTAATSLQTNDEYLLDFGGSGSEYLNFGIWWLSPNWDTSKAPNPNLPNNPTFNSVPNYYRAFIIAYNTLDGSLVPIVNADGTPLTTVGSNVAHINELLGVIANDADVVSSRYFVTAYSTEFFGTNWTFDGTKITLSVSGGGTPIQFFPDGGSGGGGKSDSSFWTPDNLQFGTPQTLDLGYSAYQIARARQQDLVQRSGSDYVIRNVKTSLSPYVTFDLIDGFGGYYSFDASYINYQNPNATVKIKRLGGLGLANKVLATLDRYMDLTDGSWTNNTLISNRLLQYGVLQTQDKSTPILSNTAVATNALNQNTNQMVYANAQLAVDNNNINNNASIANKDLTNANNTAVNKKDVSLAKQTLAIQSGQKYMNTVKSSPQVKAAGNWLLQGDKAEDKFFGTGNLFYNMDKATMNATSKVFDFGAKTIGGAVSGAKSGDIAGAVGGALSGAASYTQSKDQLAIKNATSNAKVKLNNELATDTLQNTIDASTQVANNNYENTIDNYLAKQRDLSNAPATIGQQGGDLSFAYQNQLQLTVLQVKTETAQRIKIVDQYFTQFGYEYEEFVDASKFMDFVKTRTRFNYVKVIWVKLGIPDAPEADLETLGMIFMNGITIWHDYENAYDYDAINNQTSYASTESISTNTIQGAALPGTRMRGGAPEVMIPKGINATEVWDAQHGIDVDLGPIEFASQLPDSYVEA